MGNEFLTGVEGGEKEAEQPQVENREAVIRIKQDASHMTAEMEIEPPQGDAPAPTKAQIQEKLKGAGIVFGIDEAALDTLAQPLYDRVLVIATSQPPVHGNDALCEEKYPREKVAALAEREDGSVNYRELSLITDVTIGTCICEITAATEGVPGKNILGAELKAKPGKKMPVPAGEGTTLSPDGTRLDAGVAGNLVFRGGKFCVDSVFRVENIDFEIGNITFSGDVVVTGDIQDGFEIHAGGDVTMRGRVGSVKISGKNITLEQGINGTGRAVLEAAENVKAGFIENSTIIAGKKVTATSIINSKVECEGDVDVTSKHGLICGGKITAFGSVKATVVGNEFNTLTSIIMGVTPHLLEERKKMTLQLVDVEKHIDELSKNVAYIERLVADGRPVPPDRIQLLQRTQIQLPMSEKKRSQLSEKIAEMEKHMAGINNSTLSAKTIYPPTKISIGALSTNCIETRTNCRVYRSSDGELVFGTS